MGLKLYPFNKHRHRKSDSIVGEHTYPSESDIFKKVRSKEKIRKMENFTTRAFGYF